MLVRGFYHEGGRGFQLSPFLRLGLLVRDVVDDAFKRSSIKGGSNSGSSRG
ncbi:UNVERIFIED_ORG: hypothetical protein QOE_2283 [Clostridioides difficile F501]